MTGLIINRLRSNPYMFQKVIGENCAVVEPLYHATFDLSALRKAGASDWEVAVGGKSFLLNVCGSLRSGKGACEGAGACLQEAGGGPAVNIGTFSPDRRQRNI